jgi:hypothetical protein
LKEYTKKCLQRSSAPECVSEAELCNERERERADAM